MSVAAKLAAFAADETGVVSIDWMVISAACIGLSLATLNVVTGGLDNLSDDIAASLQGQPLMDEFTATDVTAHAMVVTGFSSGLDGWSGDGTITTVAGFGDVLVIDPNGTVETSVALPSDTQLAQITFDLIGADALASAPAEIWVNGVSVGVAYVHTGSAVFEPAPGAPIDVVLAAGAADLGAGPQSDAVLAIAVDVADPSEAITLAVRSGTSTVMSQAFYAIDNVEVIAA